MCGRTCPTVSVALPRRPSSSRRTTRTRNGVGDGAPTSRLSSWWASTSRTTIRASPSAAPREQPLERRRAAAASLRQLTDSVCLVVGGLGGLRGRS